MLILWLIDLAVLVVGFLLGLLDFLPTLELPEPIALVVPVPLVGTSGVSGLATWLQTSVVVACGLATGRVLQWVYKMVPFV